MEGLTLTLTLTLIALIIFRVGGLTGKNQMQSALKRFTLFYTPPDAICSSKYTLMDHVFLYTIWLVKKNGIRYMV